MATAAETNASHLLAELDAAQAAGDFPVWLQAHWTVGAMRLTSLQVARAVGLVFETIAYDHREQMIFRCVHAYGDALGRRGYLGVVEELVPASEMVREVGDLEVVSKVTGERWVWDERGHSKRFPPAKIPAEIALRVAGNATIVPLRMPGAVPARVSRLVHPEECVLFQLCATGELFPKFTRLAHALSLQGGAKPLYSTTAWHHPKFGQKPSRVKAFAALVQAACAGAPGVGSKTSKPNTSFGFWLDSLVAERGEKDAARWTAAVATQPLSTPPVKAKAPTRAPALQDAKPGKRSQKPPDWLLAGRAHPSFGNDGFPCGAMRLSGFAAANGSALVLQSIVLDPDTGTMTRELHAYGPAAQKATRTGLVSRPPLLEGDALAAMLRKGGGPRRGETVTVSVEGNKVRLKLDPPNHPDAERLGPAEVAMFRLVEKLSRDALFGGAINDMVGLKKPIHAQFVADAFQQAPLGKPLSASPDYVAVAIAMEERCEVRLPGIPDADYRHWFARKKIVRRRAPLWWVD